MRTQTSQALVRRHTRSHPTVLAWLVLCAWECFSRVECVEAQGTVVFNNRVTGVVVAPIYGFGAGGCAPCNSPLAGSQWSAQLYAANGGNQPEANLSPAYPVTTFRTGAMAGFVVGVTATLSNVPRDAAAATVQMRVWDNLGGALADWSQAEAAWLSGETVAGKSGLFVVQAIGGDFNPAPYLAGLQSFNICPGSCGPPLITSEPQSRTAGEGESVTFTVQTWPESGYFAARSHQWRFNGALLPGATNSGYTLPAVQPVQAGSYTVVVTNRVGVVTSAPATLSVHFKVTARADPGGAITLVWSAQPGRTYRVQHKTNCEAAASWVDHSPDVVAAGTVATNVDNSVFGVAKRFYRVVLLP